MRIYFQYATATGEVNMVSARTGIINSLYAKHRRMGHGAGLMEQIISWADGKDVTLLLTAQAYGKEMGLGNPELVRFYERYGFQRDAGPPHWPARMTRYPSRELQAP